MKPQARWPVAAPVWPSRVVRQTFTLGAGTAVGQAVLLPASLVWSRLYAPADFGRLGLILSFLSVASVAVGLRYDLAIPLARDREESIRLLLVCLLLAVPVSVFAGIVFGVFCAYDVLGLGALPLWSAPLVAALLVVTGAFVALRFWHVRFADFSNIGRSLIVQGIARALVPIALAPFHFGWLGLVAGEAAGRVFGVRRLAASVLPELWHVARNTNRQQFLELIKRFRQYPLVFLPSSVLDAIAGAIAAPVFIHLYGLSAGGEFFLAQQIVTVPAALLSATLGDVYHAKLATTARATPDSLPATIARGAARLMLLGVAIYVPTGVAAPYLVVPLFGAAWERVGHFVVVLAPAAAVTLAVSPLARALVLSRIPQVKFIADVAKIVLPIVGLVIGSRVDTASPMGALVGFSILTIASYALYLMIVIFAVRRRNQLTS